VNTGIKIIVVSGDIDVLDCLLACSNGRFSGESRMYLSHDDPSNMADALAGFPRHPSDYRDFSLGADDPKYAGGGVRMHFFCMDMAGRAAVDVKLRHDGNLQGEVESVALRIPLEAAAIDSFVEQLRKLDLTSAFNAHLSMAKSRS
jgi:hypothetical protein